MALQVVRRVNRVPLPSLLHDTRGAVLVWGTCAALLLSGVVFYVHGIGRAIEYRERMQDAADAVALATAVMHARGMNLLVLINLLMAAVLALLVALKLLSTLSAIGIAIAVGLAPVAPGSLALVPPLRSMQQTAERAFATARPKVHATLSMLHTAAHAVRSAVPLASEARALDAAAHYGPEVAIGVAVPPRLTLPTEDDRYDALCGKAGRFVGELAMKPLGAVLGSLTDRVESASESLIRGGAKWFCGAQPGRPPKATFSAELHLPELPATQRCRLAEAPAEREAACADAERELAQSRPDSQSGRCRSACGPDGPYATRVALARGACDPSAASGATDFEWQERFVERDYRFERGRWVLFGERTVSGPRLARGARAPCPAGFGRASGGPDRPLCSDVSPPPGRARQGQVATRSGREVTALFGCKVKQDMEWTVEGDDSGQQANAKHVPQKLMADVALGGDAFQLRGLSFSADDATRRAEIDRWVSLGAGGGRGSTPDPWARIAVAQAEYYFASPSGRTEPADMLWQMRWRARLRRVRAPRVDRNTSPNGPVGTGPRGAAGAPKPRCGQACKRGQQLLDAAGGWVAH